MVNMSHQIIIMLHDITQPVILLHYIILCYIILYYVIIFIMLKSQSFREFICTLSTYYLLLKQRWLFISTLTLTLTNTFFYCVCWFLLCFTIPGCSDNLIFTLRIYILLYLIVILTSTPFYPHELCP